MWWTVWLLGLGGLAEAQERPALSLDDAEEVIVYGDRFLRWDRTRWSVETQIGFPFPYLLKARENRQFRATAIQIRTIFNCEKTWKRGEKQYEVLCDIEDVSLRAVAFENQAGDRDVLRDELAAKRAAGNEKAELRLAERREKQAERTAAKIEKAAEGGESLVITEVEDPNTPTIVLAEWDQLLTDAGVELFVTDDGRVTNIGLSNFPANNRREMEVKEACRQLMLRVMSGFTMKLPKSSAMGEHQWLEYQPPAFLLPGLSASMSGGHIVHQVDKWRGLYFVQSVGKGTIMATAAGGDSSEDDGDVNYFNITYDGVALYDPDSGIMTERVWAMRGGATASSAMADGWSGSRYFSSGRLRMIAKDEKVEVGYTGRVSSAGQSVQGVPAWEPME